MVAATVALAGELTRKTGLRCGALMGDDTYAFEIIGNERYQSALAQLAGTATPGVVGVKCIALLVPGPKNPRDPSAVVVQIKGHDVGHLGRNLAPIVSRTLADAGYAAAVVAAVIVAGPGGSKSSPGQFRVRLDAVHPFRFEEAREAPAAAKTGPPRAVIAVAAALRSFLPVLRAMPRAVMVGGKAAARRSLPVLHTVRRAAVFCAQQASRLVADAYLHVRGSPKIQARLAWAAIFLAGVAVGSGLTLWTRPAPVQPAVAAVPAPPLPEAPDFGPPEADPDAVDASAPLPLATDIPLPRQRPDPDTIGKSATATPQ